LPIELEARGYKKTLEKTRARRTLVGRPPRIVPGGRGRAVTCFWRRGRSVATGLHRLSRAVVCASAGRGLRTPQAALLAPAKLSSGILIPLSFQACTVVHGRCCSELTATWSDGVVGHGGLRLVE